MEKLFCILISVLAITGIAVDYQMDPPEERRQKFVYYTNLSNLVTAVYHLFLLFALGMGGGTAFYAVITNATLRFSLTLCIFVTFVIYFFVLAPSFRKHGTVPKHPLRRYSNLCVHYFVPLLTMAEWLLFADKNVTFAGSFLWLLGPMAYSLFTMLRARTGVRIVGPRNSLYPYAFMDLERIGTKKFIKNGILVSLGFFALTAALYLVTLLF